MKFLEISLAIVFVAVNCAIGQSKEANTFNVEIEFPSNYDTDKIGIEYDDGTGQHSATVNSALVTLAGPAFSKVVGITVIFLQDQRSFPVIESFFVDTNKKAKIVFYHNETGKILSKFRVSNAVNLNSLGQSHLESMVSLEVVAVERTILENPETWYSNDSLILRVSSLNTKILEKKLKFIEANGNSYYSFWLFRREIAGSSLLDPDRVMRSFFATFSDSLRETLEGKETLITLRGRAVGKGDLAPDFLALDRDGNSINLVGYRGAYVILDFWASWCGPCIEEFPIIKDIKNSFGSTKLVVISINQDKDPMEFEKAVDAHKMNWIHLYNYPNLSRIYGVRGIPAVFLIDPSGTVIYSRDEEVDYPKLEKLRILVDSILSKK